MSFETLKETWANPSNWTHDQLGHGIIGELLEYPERLHRAELSVIEAKKRVDEIKNQIEIKRNSLLLSGVIDGKNAEVREAQIDAKLNEEKGALSVEKENLEREELSLQLVEDEYRSLLAISRILGNEDI